MNLPYNCMRLLARHPRSLQCLQQREVISPGSCSLGSWVFCSLRATGQTSSRRCLRGFRTRHAPQVENVMPESEAAILKPFLYTLGVCGCTVVGAMVWNYEKMRKYFQKLQNPKKETDKHSKELGLSQISALWTKLTCEQKMALGILAGNVAVFLLWRIPGLRNSMVKYFTTSFGHPVFSMTLSSFSHHSFFHLFVNMYVFWSFSSVVLQLMGCEQFLAFYLSAGTFSSLASLAATKFLRRPHAISLGASGALLGLIGCVCLTYPNARLSVAFISEIFPHSFSADTGMKVIILFDVIGLMLGWRLLDHAGHLGGMLFGLLYAKYGTKYIWANREAVTKYWHELRGKKP